MVKYKSASKNRYKSCIPEIAAVYLFLGSRVLTELSVVDVCLPSTQSQVGSGAFSMSEMCTGHERGSGDSASIPVV